MIWSITKVSLASQTTRLQIKIVHLAKREAEDVSQARQRIKIGEVQHADMIAIAHMSLMIR